MAGSAPAIRTVLHVDMDAFYAAVEQRDRPELKGRPVVVGAKPGGRGVVSAASYEARRFGIHSAMPISRAYRLCPTAVYLPVDMDKYAEVSRQIMALLAEWSPLLEPVSIDEAFLDVTASRALRGDGPTIARDIKARIRGEVALTASVGVAPNKFLAKVASDLEKPDGLVVVEPGGEASFLAPLPIGRLWGVGRVTGTELESLGILTIGQLASLPPATLVARFGESHGPALAELARGRDNRPVEPFGAPKSMGAEETFGADHLDMERLRATLRAQAERVARELRAEGYAGRVVTLKIRFADFSTYTRAHTGEPTQDGLRIYHEACALLERVRLVRPVRLIGVSVSGLGAAGQGQLALFGPDAVRQERLGRALDRLAERFGGDAVQPASLLGRRARRRSGPRGPAR
ncbi:MAG TPA: DNA polymerase IV [Verrucomicrobiae bacterium]|jgi:DNA polymerase IV|nr:DNA polymerase IV [Verrucomicrobiae bacterium]